MKVDARDGPSGQLVLIDPIDDDEQLELHRDNELERVPL